MPKTLKTVQGPYGDTHTMSLTKEEVDTLRVESRIKFPKSNPTYVFFGNDLVSVQPDGSGLVDVYYSIGD